MIQIETVEQYKEYRHKHKEKLIVLFFTASFCKPCKELYPLFDKWCRKFEDRVVVIKIDVNESEVAERYEIKKLPTIMFVKNNQRVRGLRIEGCKKEEIYQNIKKLLE